ncbi:MAG: hypothetical protein JNK81_01945 [Anaerolineales bacterium]|nr:hypothetical protein [Anaerolineales bacterium]
MLKKILFVISIIFILTACAEKQSAMFDLQNTVIAMSQTSIVMTQTALPTKPSSTLTPVSTDTIVYPTPSVLPSATITPTSPYEAEHREIEKVVEAYFEKLYYMRNSFQIENFDDVVSSASDGRIFLKTELRKQAVGITSARVNFLRYASYSYTLDYSEIVVFESGQRARVNLTEGNSIVYELSIPYGIVSSASGIKHIIMLRNEENKWKIIYDVYDDYSHRSLYAPTPFPEDVLNSLDKILINLSQGQSGPALPEEGKLFIPSEPEQLEKWKEYETALAEKLMPQYPRNTVLCEWELTEKTEQKLNVWAICMTTLKSEDAGSYYFPVASMPAVINIDSDNIVQSIDIPKYGNQYISDFWKLFPNGAWKDLPSANAMEKHLHWRRVHPNEPPLIVLNATTIPTATP